MSLFKLTQRMRDRQEGKISNEQLRVDESTLTAYTVNSMKIGGDRLEYIFGRDRSWFYYTMAAIVSSIVLGDDATEEQLELITRITPAMVNLMAGTVDEIGLNKQAQYVIVLGKDRRQ